MPGAFRPYSLQDVLGSMSDQIGGVSGGDTSATGTGHFTEADETLGITDSAEAAAQANPAWDSGTWSQFIWQ